jgi:hypothetical protein
MDALIRALPERADQLDESGGLDQGPAVGFELCGDGPIGHLSDSIPDHACTVISSNAGLM